MSELIFVTGASGFLGSHVVLKLLEHGHRVRGTARGSKADQLEAAFSQYRDRLEVIRVADLAHDQVSEALQGVDGLIHTAAPFPGKLGPEETFKDAVESTLNIIRQAEKAGIKRVVVTSSISTVRTRKGDSWTDKDWLETTKEEAIASGNGLTIYRTAKLYAERALWEWADAHPHVEVTTLNPPLIFGPLTDNFYLLPSPDFVSLTTDLFIFNLIRPNGTFPYNSFYIDVRDTAMAHILALESPPTAEVGRKRIIIGSPHGVSLGKVMELVEERRPDLKDRLNRGQPPSDVPDRLPADFRRVERVFGMKVEEFHTVEETIFDALDSLLKLEDIWKKAGHEFEVPIYEHTLIT